MKEDLDSRPLWESDTRFLDPSAVLPQAQPWGEMGGQPAMPTRGLVKITSSKPKQGKSLAVYGLLASIASGRPLDAFRPTGEPPRLAVVFDTEMNAATLQPRIRGLYAQMGEAAAWRLEVVPLLGVKMSERRAVISDIVSRYSPDIVAIDIVTKLPPLDPESCLELCGWLGKMAEERTVIITNTDCAVYKRFSIALDVLGTKTESYTVKKISARLFQLKAEASDYFDTNEVAPMRFFYNGESLLGADEMPNSKN